MSQARPWVDTIQLCVGLYWVLLISVTVYLVKVEYVCGYSKTNIWLIAFFELR